MGRSGFGKRLKKAGLNRKQRKSKRKELQVPLEQRKKKMANLERKMRK